MKEELLKQVESKFTEDSKIIWATKNHLELLLSQVESCQAFSERYQQQNSEGQMLPLLNQLLHYLTDLDNAVINASVIFGSTIPLTHFKKSVLNLSSLGTLSVPKDAIFTWGSLQMTSTVFVYKKTTLLYILNEPLAYLVRWECKYGQNDNLTSTCPVVVASDNQLEIEFTPTESGTYSFQLIPTGCPIVGIQKFTVTAYEDITKELVVEPMKEVTKKRIQQTAISYGLPLTNSLTLTTSSYGKNMKPPEKPKRSCVADNEEIPAWKKRLKERCKQRLKEEEKDREVEVKNTKPPEKVETSNEMDEEEKPKRSSVADNEYIPGWKKRLEERRKQRLGEKEKDREIKVKDTKPPEKLETSNVMDKEEEKPKRSSVADNEEIPAWKKRLEERRKQRLREVEKDRS